MKYGKKLHIANLSHTHFLPKIRIGKHGCITIGKQFRSDKNVLLDCESGKIQIGNNVFINRGVCIVSRESIVINDNVIIGPYVLIYDHDHDFKNKDSSMLFNYMTKPIFIGRNVWIGGLSLILMGAKIGDYCVIGSSTLIKKEIFKGCLVYDQKDEQILQISTIKSKSQKSTK